MTLAIPWCPGNVTAVAEETIWGYDMVRFYPDVTIEELLVAVSQGGAPADEASVVLAMLLEKRAPEDDMTLAGLAGPGLAGRRLSRAERRSAVDGLIEYIQDTPNPHPPAVWALGKSYAERAVPVLLRLLDATVDDPAAVPLAYQTVLVVEVVGTMTRRYRAEAHAALRRAAVRGHGEVAEAAQQYLSIQRQIATPPGNRAPGDG